MNTDKFSHFNENPFEQYFKNKRKDKEISGQNPDDTIIKEKIPNLFPSSASSSSAAGPSSRNRQATSSRLVPSEDVNDFKKQMTSLLVSQQKTQKFVADLYQRVKNPNQAPEVQPIPVLERQDQNWFLSRNPLGNLSRILRRRPPAMQHVNSKIRKWQDIIQRATSVAPGEIAAQDLAAGRISQAKYDEMIREEWLVKPPLTGICTGLALDFIIALEKGKAENRDVASTLRMQPSSNARYFELLLIPIVLWIAKESGIDPEKLDTSRYGRRIYEEMIKVVREKTGLEGQLILQNADFSGIDRLRMGQGHQLLLLENPNGGVTMNHTVYFNHEKRIIADGADGKVMHVPQDVDFQEFFSYYIKETYRNTYSSFSIIGVDASKQVPTVPGFLEQNILKLKIVALSILCAVT